MGEPVTPYKGREAEPVIDQALEMYDQGFEIEQAAVKLNVPARTIHRWLAANAPDRWKQAQQGRAQADYELVRKRRDEARATLEQLRDALKDEGVDEGSSASDWRLAHAREVLKAADTELKHQEWLLERLMRRIYGQVQAQSVASVQININLRRDEQNRVVGESST